MLVKLTEVCSNGALSTGQEYTLREVLVNPEHIVMIREDVRIRRLNEQGLLHDGLDAGHRFSKLTINRGNTGTEIVVVGAPAVVETSLVANSKQLLRG